MRDTAPPTAPDPTESLNVPSQTTWDAMTGAEQSHVETRIINALEDAHSMMGETTVHFQARSLAADVLRRYFHDQGKKVFIASDLHTLYPSEKAFYPDLLVVFEAEDHHRRSWNVLREKKGLDFVLEILSQSTRRKDQVEKLNLFARLGIPEYFMFDPDKFTLRGYRLKPHSSNHTYEEIPASQPQRVFSDLLGLYLTIDAHKLRFILPQGSDVLFADELIDRLNHKLSDKDKAIADSLRQMEEAVALKEEEKEEERRQKDEERRLKEVEKARADKLEAELLLLRKQLNKQS